MKKLISGAQTGADQGALRAGAVLGLATGGEVPKGWKTETGSNPSLAKYGCIESHSSDYFVRTRSNIINSDATVIFATNIRSRGTAATILECQKLNKQLMVIKLIEDDGLLSVFGITTVPGLSKLLLREFVGNFDVVNFAGNRESKSPGIADFVEQYLVDNLR